MIQLGLSNHIYLSSMHDLCAGMLCPYGTSCREAWNGKDYIGEYARQVCSLLASRLIRGWHQAYLPQEDLTEGYKNPRTSQTYLNMIFLSFSRALWPPYHFCLCFGCC